MNGTANSNEFTRKNNEIPILLMKDLNSYTTIKHINHFMFLTILLTTYDVKKDWKRICSKFLDDEISKNILTDTIENKNIKSFIQSMIECKIIADFDYNIDLTDTLNDLKKLFYKSIEEHRKEIEENHKSALELTDNLIEQHENKQKYFHLLMMMMIFISTTAVLNGKE
ncbi:unnamed protein product [Didymodactylos carnosus]|uniref:Uncharacterized protein n=1 Tax=Didymodactylos carnosus TaxID=1234261 RepID=A0A8S2WXQ8_9BILA|nr:unnamed protein product [Didymodactylos carnosus]CAF4466501.1 unnamed protein product [Didymodactylos carnosus]